MVQYLACFRNEKGHGPVAELFSDDEEGEIHAFVAKHDRPGFAVYRCVSPLKEGSTRRSLEDVDQIDKFCVDIDFKDLEDNPEAVKTRLLQLPLSPTLVLESGGGLHLVFLLKEPIYADEPEFAAACALLKLLTRCLSGDPAPAHPAALLREINTHNTKRGEPVQVKPLWGSGQPVDITEIEALVELLPEEGTFPRKAANGRDPSPPAAGEYKPAIDVDELLDGAAPGDINQRALLATGSLIRRGISVDETVSIVLEALHRAVPGGSDSDWDRRRGEFEGQCYRLIRKEPDLYDRLPDHMRARWEQYLGEGEEPYLLWTQSRGWEVRRCRPGAKKDRVHKTGGTEEAGRSSSETHKGDKVLTLKPWRMPTDEASLPPRKWLYGRHYQRNVVGMTAGPGGMGKSSLDMVEAVAMATARNLLGEQPDEMLRVWYHNGEDPVEELDRKLVAICKHYSIGAGDISARLFVTSGNTFPLRVARGYANIEVDRHLVQRISEEISKNEIDVAIFDPLVTLHSVSELDTGKMDAVVRLFAGIADENACSIDLAHHVRKPAAGAAADYDVHDIRGVTAITDAVRAARVLNRMSEKDAKAAGLSEIERMTRFRVDRAKGNYSPPQAATWRQLINVELLNGDDVGVVAPWEFSEQGEETPERAEAHRKADAMFMQLLRKYLERGAAVSINRGPTYAPTLFAEDKEARLAKVSKDTLKAAMDRLLEAGKIASTPARSGRSHRLHIP